MALVIQMVSFKMIIKMDIEINLIYDRKLQIKNYKIFKLVTKLQNLQIYYWFFIRGYKILVTR